MVALRTQKNQLERLGGAPNQTNDVPPRGMEAKNSAPRRQNRQAIHEVDLSEEDPSHLTATTTSSARTPNDPTPAAIRRGREFLYSTRFSIDDSGAAPKGGFVSCAACHVDGRTDGLPWDLGGLEDGPVIPPEFHDLNGEDTASMPLFPSEKGPMVTQTLQGLVNFQIEGTFFHKFWLGTFPLDWQRVTLEIEDTHHTRGQLLYVPDLEDSGVHPVCRLPGWVIVEETNEAEKRHVFE